MKVKAIGFAKKILGFEEKEFEFKGIKRLSELIDFKDKPINLIAVIINEQAATIDAEVKNTDKVIITQIVAGG